jgi:hypothetical protein
MERPTCNTCPYFDKIPESDEGQCRRRAPAPQVSDQDFAPFWPKTDFEDWCGEHPDFPAYIASLKTEPHGMTPASPEWNASAATLPLIGQRERDFEAELERKRAERHKMDR